MNQNISIAHKITRRLMGERFYSRLRDYRQRKSEDRFRTSQTTVQIQIGRFTLDMPSGHVLARLQAVQPYRDLAIGIAARELARKYPRDTFVDIGANIGDTAALMATYADNPKVLVEPSDFFSRFLQINATRIPAVTAIHQVLISGRTDQTEQRGRLIHGGGTARFESDDSGEAIAARRLSDVADERTCFVKIDTDGYDVGILAASLDFLARRRPCLFFENIIATQEALAAADRLNDDLIRIGYRYFAVFDDAGQHVASTEDPAILKSLNRYLFKVFTGPKERDLYNWDLLCLSAEDQDIYKAVTAYYATY